MAVSGSATDVGLAPAQVPLGTALPVCYDIPMIRKVVTRHVLGDPQARIRDRDYWLSLPPCERWAAVDFLRRQLHGDTERLQRIARVIQRKPR